MKGDDEVYGQVGLYIVVRLTRPASKCGPPLSNCIGLHRYFCLAYAGVIGSRVASEVFGPKVVKRSILIACNVD